MSSVLLRRGGRQKGGWTDGRKAVERMTGIAVQGRPLVMLEGQDVEGGVTALQEAVQSRPWTIARSRGEQQVVGSIGAPDCGKIGCRRDRVTVRRRGCAIDASRGVEAHLGGWRGGGRGGRRRLWEVARG